MVCSFTARHMHHMQQDAVKLRYLQLPLECWAEDGLPLSFRWKAAIKNVLLIDFLIARSSPHMTKNSTEHFDQGKPLGFPEGYGIDPRDADTPDNWVHYICVKSCCPPKQRQNTCRNWTSQIVRLGHVPSQLVFVHLCCSLLAYLHNVWGPIEIIMFESYAKAFANSLQV